MTKNKTNTPSNDGEFLDSDFNESTQSYKSENEQEQNLFNTEDENDKDVVLDKTPIKEITIPLTLSNDIKTSSKNTTSTQKYKVVLSTPTKIVIDVNGNGASYSPTQFTKTLTIGDEIELPPEEGE